MSTILSLTRQFVDAAGEGKIDGLARIAARDLRCDLADPRFDHAP
jgi:hypothetical protein